MDLLLRIALHRALARQWRERGYNAILLPDEYEKLNRQDRIRRIPQGWL